MTHKQQELLDLAKQALVSHEFSKAEKYAHELLAICDVKEDEDLFFNTTAVLAQVLFKIGKAAEAVLYIEPFYDTLIINHSNSATNLLITAGHIYRESGNTSKAQECYSRALEREIASDNQQGIAAASGSLGLIYKSLGDTDRALKYIHKQLDINRTLGRYQQSGGVVNNIALVYSMKGEHEKALEYFKEAYSLLEHSEDKLFKLNVLMNLGQEYGVMGNYDKLMEYCDIAELLNREVQSQSAKLAIKINRAIILLYKDYKGYNPEIAIENLHSAYDSCKRLGLKPQMLVVLDNLYRAYKLIGKWEESLKYLEQYLEVEKELKIEEAKKQALEADYKHKQAEAERDRQVKLAAFKAKETILYRVLPPQIAERIAEGEEQIADYFPTVSILFADIEGFTPMTADMPAHLVVQLLNHVFRHFDQIMKKHGCEKIKTIGDGYMAVAGAPTECADHAERMAAAAMEMIQPIDLPEEIMPFIPDGKKFSIRIGIHTGSVVAGVVGEDRFVYDIYSDAVNTAARMESHGENGRIHVSSDFMKHLSNRFSQTKNTTHGIRFESRGEMEIKGKGKMKTYFIGKSN